MHFKNVDKYTWCDTTELWSIRTILNISLYSIKCHIMMHAVRQVLFLEHYSQTEAYIKETLS